ncbi:cytoplasmic protein [Fictibacillus sp. KIGAM418]|uniref:Cytoplasmic protein n=1 Tax=Fictibacillus marinisediminis TaxID=2878389 RepID=A0A9X1XA94_9BACL|nr:cytoplasmic protein [Fictibacillus marinisediminis]MCK6256100.1 cytoplasmic protein [Fictibacillus marinisediminis]
MAEANNLTMNGSGSASGGLYNKVKITGEGTITDDFECTFFKTYGSSEVSGNAKAEVFEIFGETEVKKNLDVRNMKVLGTLSIGESAKIDNTKILGTVEVAGRFTGNKVDLKGSIVVKGDLEAEEFVSSGLFEVSGLLNADVIDVKLRYSTSHVQEMGGETIRVQKKGAFLPFMKNEGYLEAKTIEGDDIFLENTTADVVRGKFVRIGSGCEIGLVEYYEEFKALSGSSVKEHRKID